MDTPAIETKNIESVEVKPGPAVRKDDEVVVDKEAPSAYSHVGVAVTALIGFIQLLLASPTPYSIGASVLIIAIAAWWWDRSSERAGRITLAKMGAAKSQSEYSVRVN